MSENALASRLRERHPLYNQFAADWQFYADSYEGGDAYREKGYLHKHLRETDKDFAERIERAVFTNFTRKQIDIYASFIFREAITRESTDGTFKEFEENADRRGTSFSQIMSDQVGKIGMIHGHAVTIVDLPKESRTARTRRDDKLLGIRPYLTTYSPLDVVDWAIDAEGKYVWIRVAETAPDTSSPFTSRSEPSTIYRTWTRDEWFVHDDDGLLLDQGEHDLGEVPAVLTPVKEHLKYMDVGESLLVDTAVLNRAIFNYESLLDEFLYRQCLTGDTLIDCPRDLEKYPHGIPIKELVGKEFMTYAWDIENKCFTLKKASDVRRTARNREVWRLTFSYRDEYNQQKTGHIDGTPDHPILLQNGEYVALKDLKPDDRLVPMYRWIDGYPRGNRPHILQGLSPYSGMAEHRFIIRELGTELQDGFEVHHIDERALNNEPSNLTQISKKEHAKLTAAANGKRKKEWWANATETEKRFVTTRAQAGRKKWLEDPEAVAEAYARQSKSIKKTLRRLSADARKAKVEAALQARGIQVEQVNHRVVSVEKIGVEDVYNMEVEDLHNYVANGIVVHNCFNILAIPVDEKIPGDRRQNVASELGTNKGIRYPSGGSPPSYISPPSDPADVIMRRIGETQRSLIEVAKLQDRKGSETQKSGIAHAYEFHESNSAFAKIAKNLEGGEREILRLVYKWSGRDEVPVTVAYPTDFNVTTLADTIEEALGLIEVNVGPTFTGLVRKRVAHEAFPEMDEETEQAIDDEIASTPAVDAVELELQRRLAEETASEVDAQKAESPQAQETPPASPQEKPTPKLKS